jgi:hypothetical protein
MHMYITVPSPPPSPYLPKLHPCQLQTSTFDTRHHRELIRTYRLKYRRPLTITPTYDLLPVDFYGPAFWSCPTLLLDRLSPKSRKCLWRNMALNVLCMSVSNLTYRPLSRRLQYMQNFNELQLSVLHNLHWSSTSRFTVFPRVREMPNGCRVFG